MNGFFYEKAADLVVNLLIRYDDYQNTELNRIIGITAKWIIIPMKSSPKQFEVKDHNRKTIMTTDASTVKNNGGWGVVRFTTDIDMCFKLPKLSDFQWGIEEYDRFYRVQLNSISQLSDEGNRLEYSTDVKECHQISLAMCMTWLKMMYHESLKPGYRAIEIPDLIE